MAIRFEVNARVRDVQGKGASRRLRRDDQVPVILYGGGEEPQMLQVAHNEMLQHLEHEAFYSRILKIMVDGKPTKAVLKDVQRHPAKPRTLHADFLRVHSDDRIRMHVPLHFINEDTAPGVKTGGGMVSHNMNDVEISCLAKDLPEFIEVDLGGMNLGDSIHLSQLHLPEGAEVVALAHGPEHDLAVVTIHSSKTGSEEEEQPDESEKTGE